MQGDFQIAYAVDKNENAELRSSIGKAKPSIGAENPTVSGSHYMRGSGTEGTAPDYNDLLKAGIGTEVVAGTAYLTTASSTQSLIKMAASAGSHFQRGQGMLLKHANAAWEVAVVHSVATDDITPAFKLKTAPASGVSTGKCVLYKPADTGHQTLSLWRYLGNGGATQCVAGCRVTAIGIAAQAGQFINGSISLAGLGAYFNPVTIGASETYLDFTDGSTDYAAQVTAKTYKDPKELADALADAMDAANSGNVHTVTYDKATGKYTIASDNATFSLLWSTGTNTANTIGAKLGFVVSADDTGAVTYTGDNALSFASPYTPTLDNADPATAKSGVCYLGDSTDNVNFEASSINIDWAFDRGVNKSVCSESGNASSLITGRTVTVKGKALLAKFDSDAYSRFREGTTTRFLYVWGRKSGGNWVPGETMYCYVPTMSITSFSVSEDNGLAALEFEGTAFVDSSGNGEAYLGQL
jgi:hypothetical protein